MDEQEEKIKKKDTKTLGNKSNIKWLGKDNKNITKIPINIIFFKLIVSPLLIYGA